MNFKPVVFKPLEEFTLLNLPSTQKALVDLFTLESKLKGSKNIRRNGVALIINKGPECNLKNDRMISVRFQGKPFNITVIQVYSPTTDAEEAEADQFYEDLEELLALTPKKRCSIHHQRLECNSRKSRCTWSNRQVWPWRTKWREKANWTLPRECTSHSKYSL